MQEGTIRKAAYLAEARVSQEWQCRTADIVPQSRWCSNWAIMQISSSNLWLLLRIANYAVWISKVYLGAIDTSQIEDHNGYRNQFSSCRTTRLQSESRFHRFWPSLKRTVLGICGMVFAQVFSSRRDAQTPLRIQGSPLHGAPHNELFLTCRNAIKADKDIASLASCMRGLRLQPGRTTLQLQDRNMWWTLSAWK